MFDGLKKLKEKLFPSSAEKTGKLSFLQWVLILACLGIALMILADFFADQYVSTGDVIPEEDVDVEVQEYEETIGKVSSSANPVQDYEEYLENQLKEILSKIQGVGDVTVMVNLDSSEEVVVEKDRQTQQSLTDETDQEGGNRHVEEETTEEQVVRIQQGNDEDPLIIKTKKPSVRGVLVVAPGAENVQVKTWLIEAVQRVLDVPAHRVSVLPKTT